MTCTVKKKTRYVFDKISQLAKELGISVYVVGGYVRDLLREQDGLDLDIGVIGNALEFCREFKTR